jgi:hypothetical protein
MPALREGRARHNEPERAGVVQASREETAEWSDAVRATAMSMEFAYSKSVERDDLAGTSDSDIAQIPAGGMVVPDFLGIDAAGIDSIAA